jgi:hypothetical protein
MFCKCKKKYILIITNFGIANQERLRIMLKNIYNIEGEYECEVQEYESKKYKFLICSRMDGSSFNREHFQNSVYSVKSNIKAIICLENLNPRSNYLKGNLDELRQVFTADELWKKLYVFFSFGTSKKPSSLEKLREDVLDFNEMYELIGLFQRIARKGFFSCSSRVQPDKILAKENRLKIKFNSKRVWILDDAYKSTLFSIKF